MTILIEFIINILIAIFFYRYGYKHGWIDKKEYEQTKFANEFEIQRLNDVKKETEIKNN